MVYAIFHHLTTPNAYVATVEGHAGFAEMGKDVVCAGASMYAMGLAQCVMQMHQDGKLQKKPVIEVKNGRVYVVGKPKPEHEAELRDYFYMAQVGLALLQESYPKHVSLKLYEASLRGDSDKDSSTNGQTTSLAHSDGQEEPYE